MKNKLYILFIFFLFNNLKAQKEPVDTVFFPNKNVKTIRYRKDYLLTDISRKRFYRPSNNYSKIKDEFYYNGHFHEPSTGYISWYNDTAYGGYHSYYGKGPQHFNYYYNFPYFNNIEILFRFRVTNNDTVLVHFSICSLDSSTMNVKDYIHSLDFNQNKQTEFANVFTSGEGTSNWVDLGTFGKMSFQFYPKNKIKTLYFEYRKNGANKNIYLKLRPDFSIESYSTIYNDIFNSVYTKNYYTNGYIESEGLYRKDLKEGNWKYYDLNEIIVKTEAWNNGVVEQPKQPGKKKKRKK